jgi:hypothetical protein
MRFAPLLLLLAIALSTGVIAQPTSGVSAMLLDATWVPCNDSTENLYVLADGRAIYALGDRGIVFTLIGGLLDDLKMVTKTAQSDVDVSTLDSCTTLGLILDHKRYMLINTMRPTPATRDVKLRLERIRNYARRQLAQINKLNERLGTDPDTTIVREPVVEQNQLSDLLDPNPVARQWRCRGSVLVSAKVAQDGHVRQAFVDGAQVRGKCASLLTTTALRAVLQATFQPARKKNGRAVSAWMQVEVAFGVTGQHRQTMGR